MANEVNLGFAFLYAKLSTDATLTSIAVGGVYRGSAPSGTATPFIVIGYQAGRDNLTMNRVRMLCKPLYLVKAVGPAKNTAAIVSASNRLDDLLKKAPGAAPETTPGGLISSYYREEPLQYDENLPTGEKWTHTGGLYRLEIQQV